MLRSALKLVTSTAHLCQLFMLLCTFSKYCWTVAKLWLRSLTCDLPAEHFLEQKSLLLLATRSGTGNCQLRTLNWEWSRAAGKFICGFPQCTPTPALTSTATWQLWLTAAEVIAQAKQQWQQNGMKGEGKEKEKGNQLPSLSLMSSGKTNFYDFSN